MHCQTNKTHRVVADAFLKCWLPEGSQHAHYIFHRAEYRSIQLVGKGQVESKRLGKIRIIQKVSKGELIPQKLQRVTPASKGLETSLNLKELKGSGSNQKV